MKKTIIAGSFAILGMIAFSSCQKEYTCTCSTAGVVSTETAKGSDATDACNSLTSVLQLKACVPA